MTVLEFRKLNVVQAAGGGVWMVVDEVTRQALKTFRTEIEATRWKASVSQDEVTRILAYARAFHDAVK